MNKDKEKPAPGRGRKPIESPTTSSNDWYVQPQPETPSAIPEEAIEEAVELINPDPESMHSRG